METLDVPDLPELPDPAPYGSNAVTFADFLLTNLFRHSPALLHAEYLHPQQAVTWFIRRQSTDESTQDVSIAVSPSVGSFRSVLARFGHHYMGGQLYHGFAMRFLRQHDRIPRCFIYTSNMGQSGFWIRVYAAAFSPFSESLSRPR
jgi:hypothetical protein